MSLLSGFQLHTDQPDVSDEPVRPDPPRPSRAAAPLVVLEGGQLSERQQYAAMITHLYRVTRRRIRDLAEREGSVARGLATGKPPSLAEQDAYARAKNGIPAGHDGGVIEGMWVIYHWLIGRPGVAFGNAWSAISSRALRGCITGALLLLTAGTILALAGHARWDLYLAAGAGLLVAAWAAAGHVLMRLTEAPDPPVAASNLDEDEELIT